MDNPFLPEEEQPQKPTPNIGGNFSCQVCNEKVTAAYLDNNTKILMWWCSEDHMSFIKEFLL